MKLLKMLPRDSWVVPYLRKYWKTLVLAITLGVCTFASGAALMFNSGYLISKAASLPVNILLIYVPVVLTRAFGIARPVFRYIERLTSHNWVFKLTSDLRRRLYLSLEQEFYTVTDRIRLGDMLGLLSEDIGHLQNLYLRTIFPLLVAILLSVAIVIALGVFSIFFGLAMLLMLAVAVFVFPLVSSLRLGAVQEREKQQRNALYTQLTDNVLGVADWTFSGRSEDFVTSHEAAEREIRGETRRLHRFSYVRNFLLELFFGLIVIVVTIWAGARFHGVNGGAANWIAAFVLAIFPLIDVYAPLSDAVVETNIYADSIKRFNELPEGDATGAVAALSRDKGSVADSSCDNDAGSIPSRDNDSVIIPSGANETVSLLSRDNVSASAPSRDNGSATTSSRDNIAATALEIDQLSFSYGDREILKGLSLTLKKGEKLALLGKSGAGKSTLAKLIYGGLSQDAGSIRLDGQLLTPGRDVTAAVGVIHQNPYLFHTTLRNNLRIGNERATDAAITAALDAVGLGELLGQLSDGLDTTVDEAGLRFSGGERHRIALARILLKDAPLVILDEATIGLDPITESQVLARTFELLQDRTVLFITHHLLGVDGLDRVVFLENGRITLDGSPGHLAAESPHYRELLTLDRGWA